MYGPGGGGKSFDRGRNKKKQNKSKNHFRNQQAESKKTNELREGINGFLVTAEANAEKRALKEGFNILNDAVENVYPDLAARIPEIVQEFTEK